MEIVLNFDKKELIIKERSNVKKLFEKLENLLGKDLKNWEIVSDVIYQRGTWWYSHEPYPYITWGSDVGTITTGTYCLTDDSAQVDTIVTN